MGDTNPKKAPKKKTNTKASAQTTASVGGSGKKNQK